MSGCDKNLCQTGAEDKRAKTLQNSLDSGPVHINV